MKAWAIGDARQECGEVAGGPGAGDTKLLGDMRDAKIRQVSNINHSVSTCLQDPVDSMEWSEGAHSPPESTWIGIGAYESC